MNSASMALLLCDLLEGRVRRGSQLIHPGSKADAGVRAHGTSRRASCSITPQRIHDLTHKHNCTPQPHRSRMLTSVPGLKSKSKAPRLTANFAGRTKPVNGLARCKTAPIPIPHSQSTRTHHNTTHAASMGRAEGAPWVLSSATPFQILSKLPRGF